MSEKTEQYANPVVKKFIEELKASNIAIGYAYCPFCGGSVHFVVGEKSNQVRAACSTENCLKF